MPARSKDQAIAARIAEGIKKGKVKGKPGTASFEMAKSMSLPTIQEFSETPVAKLPRKTGSRTGLPKAAGSKTSRPAMPRNKQAKKVPWL